MTGREDRRQRLLYPTQKGRDLIKAVSQPQSRRIRRALDAVLKAAGKDREDPVARFMQAMKNPQ